MQTMAVAWNGTTLNDKVKLLSVTELGSTHQYVPAVEGNRYYEYGPHIKDVNYWLRTRWGANTASTWLVLADGNINGASYSMPYCLAPIIRLG